MSRNFNQMSRPWRSFQAVFKLRGSLGGVAPAWAPRKKLERPDLPKIRPNLRKCREILTKSRKHVAQMS
jgi:hypothetical protein